MLEWTDDHKTGMKEFDDLNTTFHNKLNEFLQANVEGKGREHVAELLSFLESYATKHIQDQKKIMERNSLEGETDHIGEHNHFQAEVQKFRTLYEAEGVTSTMVLELQNIMGEWFVNHIGVKDLELAKKIKGQAIR